MTNFSSIQDIDFGSLYREHMAAVGRPKPPSVWDARAEGMTLPPSDLGYTAEFVRRMDLSDCASLLDVGCGPGHIALAVAHRLSSVHGLDYSPRMLEVFMRNAQAQGVTGVSAILRSWDEDWCDVPECDIVVASRSTAVQDMADALCKLNDKAHKRVYLTSLVGGLFGDTALQAAIGRPVPPALPDYIYILNILHAMGIHARVDFIAAEAPRAVYTHFEDLLRHVQSREGDLSTSEQNKLKTWFDVHRLGTRRPTSAQWALIAWDK